MEFLQSTGYLPETDPSGKRKISRLQKIIVIAVAAYAPVWFGLLPQAQQQKVIETSNEAGYYAQVYKAKIKQTLFEDTSAKHQLQEELRHKAEVCQKEWVDLIDFFLRAEYYSGQFSHRDYQNAKQRAAILVDKFTAMKQEKPDPVEVLHELLNERKIYTKGSASITQLLLSDGGNCEAIAKFVQMMFQKTFPEIPQQRLRIRAYKDHVVVLFDDVTGQQYRIEKPTPQVVLKENLEGTVEYPASVWIEKYANLDTSVTYTGQGSANYINPGKSAASDSIFDLQGGIPEKMLQAYAAGPIPARMPEKSYDFHEAQKALDPDKPAPEIDTSFLDAQVLYIRPAAEQKNQIDRISEAKKLVLNRHAFTNLITNIPSDTGKEICQRLVSVLRNDKEFLKKLVLDHTDAQVNESDRDGYGKLLLSILESMIVDGYTDDDFFMTVYTQFSSKILRQTAILGIQDPAKIEHIICTENDWSVVEAAFAKVTNLQLLETFASLSEELYNPKTRDKATDRKDNDEYDRIYSLMRRRAHARKRILGLRKGEKITNMDTDKNKDLYQRLTAREP